MKFKIGDPVLVMARNTRHFDAVGTVVDVSDMHYPFKVGGLADAPLWFGPHELTLAEHQPNIDEKSQS